MEITKKFLIDNHACESGYQWWLDHGNPSDVIQTLRKLTEDNHNNWANWVIVRIMAHEQKYNMPFSQPNRLSIFLRRNILPTIDRVKQSRPQKII